MEDLSLHVLDIVENSISAKAKNIEIKISEDVKNNLLTLEIKDDGCGMGEKTIRICLDPFFSTKGKKTGLGLSLLYQAAKEAGGDLTIESQFRNGTKIVATFVWNHIDRKPIGDMLETLAVLVSVHPEVNFIYEHKKNDKILSRFP